MKVEEIVGRALGWFVVAIIAVALVRLMMLVIT
jgi:hypothetical protein